MHGWFGKDFTNARKCRAWAKNANCPAVAADCQPGRFKNRYCASKHEVDDAARGQGNCCTRYGISHRFCRQTLAICDLELGEPLGSVRFLSAKDLEFHEIDLLANL